MSGCPRRYAGVIRLTKHDPGGGAKSDRLAIGIGDRLHTGMVIGLASESVIGFTPESLIGSLPDLVIGSGRKTQQICARCHETIRLEPDSPIQD